MKTSTIIQHNGWGAFTAPRNERSAEYSFQPTTKYIDQIPPYAKLVDALHVMGQGVEVQILLLVGEARVHPKDDYIKKEGVRIAMENAKEERYVVREMSITNKNEIRVKVSGDDFDISFKVPKESRPKLISMKRTDKKGGCDNDCGSGCKCGQQ